MNYQKHYDLLIKTRWNRELDPTEYYEKHHIIPKCLNGTDDSANVIYLTAREHYIAHWLLAKNAKKNCTKTEYYKLACAFNYMRYGNKYQNKNFSSFDYEIAKKVFIKAQTGKKHTDKHRENIGKGIAGKKHTDETKKKLSKAITGKKWINKNGKSKLVNPDELQSYLDYGWELGSGKKDTIWINKNGKSKRVYSDGLQSYLDNGWKLGRGKT